MTPVTGADGIDDQDSLLAAVAARLESFAGRRDPSLVLGPEADAALEALVRATPDTRADIRVANAVGWMHWYRYLVLDPGEDQPELEAAAWWFSSVYQEFPDRVPEPIAELLDDGPAWPGPARPGTTPGPTTNGPSQA